MYDLIGRDRASPAFNRAGESATRLERTVSAAGKAVVVAGAAMAAGAVVVGAESVKMGVQFQASMEKIHTLAGASQGSVDSLTKSVLKMAPATQQGPEQLSEALYHLKSVGMDNADAMKALKQASDLAAVGGANLEDTTNALAGAWRSGIKGAQSFSQTAATVNAIIGAGNMQMSDFTAAMGTGILPAAKTFGVSLSSVGSALALMTDEGVPATDAATRLRMSLSLMGAPSHAAEKALSSIGLTGTQLATAMRGPQGLVGAVQMLHDHLKNSGLSAVEAAQVISHAFGGGRSSSAIMTMLNNLDVLEKKQRQINKTMGNFGGAVAAQRKTAQAQFKLLESGLDTLFIKLGLVLLPPVTAFVRYLSSTAVPAVAAFSRKVAQIIPVEAIKKDFDQARNWIDNLFGVKKKPKPVKIPVQMGPLVKPQPNLFTPLARKPVKVPVQLGPSVRPQNNLFTPLPKTSDTAKASASFAGTLMSAVKKINWGKLFADVLSGAVSGAQQIGAAFMNLLGKINWTQLGGTAANVLVGLAVGIVNGLVPALMNEVIHHPLDMVMFILSLIPIGKAAGILIDVLKDIPFIGPLVKFFLGPIEKVGGMVESALGKMLKKVFGPLADRIGGYFKDAGSWLLGKGEELLLGLWYGAEHAWGTVAEWLGKLGDLLLKPFAKAGKWLLSKGTDIMSGLWDGQKAAWSWVWGWLGKIGDWIGSVFAKAGSWLVSHGRELLAGFWDGQKAAWSVLWDWLGKLGGWIIGNFARGASWLIGHGRDIIVGLWNGQKAGWVVVWGWIQKIGGWIVSAFARAGSWLVGHGGDIIRGLKNGIWDAVKGIGGWIKSHVVDPVVNAVKHFFGIHSPSTVMAELGSHLMSGLFKGMSGSNLTGMIKKIFGSMPDALTAIVGKGLVSVANLPQKALSALGSAVGAGGSWVEGILGKLFGSGGGGNTANEALGKRMAAALGWTGSQWTALQALWQRESGWSTTAKNPQSGAYGIPQSLPASKMASAGSDFLTNPATQIKWGLGYIAGRYGSPAGAWAHETSAGWYAKGTPGAKPGWAWVGEQGRELVNFHGGETVLSHGDSMRAAAGGMAGYASGTLTASERAAAVRHEAALKHHEAVVAAEHRRHEAVLAAERRRRAAAYLKTERKTGEGVADVYMSGAVTTLSKIASEQRNAVKAIQKYYSGRPAAWAENVIASQSRHLTTLADRLSTLTSQHKAAVSYQSSVASSLSGTGALSGLTIDPFQSGGGLASQLSAKLAQLKKFASSIGQLKKAGLSKGLLQQVVAMGPDDGYTYAQAMLSGGSSLIRQLNTTESAISGAASGTAHTAAVAVYGSAIVNGFSRQQAALEKQMKSLGATMGREVARWLGVPKSKLPHYGHGGSFAAGQAIVVGDRGAELAVFGQSGRILSGEQSAAAVRGGDGAAAQPLVGVVNVNHVPGFTTTGDLQNALQSAARQARVARR